MGSIYAEVKLINAGDLEMVRREIMKKEEVRSLIVNVLVDTGAFMMAIPEHIAIQLDLPVLEHREFTLADGASTKLPVVGPVAVEFKNRKTICYAAMIKDDEVLLGAIALEDMDVVLNPKKGTMEINPESPYMPRMKMKQLAS